MEMANTLSVRTAVDTDRSAVTQLLRTPAFSHYHADWALPIDWLGTAGFLVAESSDESAESDALRACFVTAADPPPAAWVRLVAIAGSQSPFATLSRMLPWQQAYLREAGVSELAWLGVDGWADAYLPGLGFRRVNEIWSYVKEDLAMPRPEAIDVQMRAITPDDLPALVAIEAEAFDPLWRHSLSSLRQAMSHAISFHVAEQAGEIIGFQYSTTGHSGGAHLARMTVARQAQRQGVGAALLRAAVDDYDYRGFSHVTLNTQSDNRPSQLLYGKFGFSRVGPGIPVWSLSLD